MAALWIAIISLSAVAQTTQLATLQHQDQVSIYYGAESLKEAVAAAADGDVITLSAGQFDAVTFDKELTVRGAGMGIIDAPGYSMPTIINGSCSARKGLAIEALTMDGLYISGDTKIVKCYIHVLGGNTNYYSGNVTVVQSKLRLTNLRDGHVEAINSYILNTFYNSTDCADANLVNCVLYYSRPNGNLTIANYLTMTNCVIRSADELGYVVKCNSSVAMFNCILCGNIDTTNARVDNTDLIRKDITTVFKDEGYCELLDEFKTFSTTDGKEVGIYGENLGFSQTPNNPQIKKFSVAPRTSADGKLSVEIEVEGLE